MATKIAVQRAEADAYAQAGHQPEVREFELRSPNLRVEYSANGDKAFVMLPVIHFPDGLGTDIAAAIEAHGFRGNDIDDALDAAMASLQRNARIRALADAITLEPTGN